MKRSLIMTTAVALTGLTLLVTGCSNGDSGEKKDNAGSNSSSGGNGGKVADDALKMRQCLRDNGIDVPDPKAGQDPSALSFSRDMDQEKLKEAMKTCGPQGPDAGNGPTQEEKDKALKKAQCMRNNGVNVKDPELSGDSMTGLEIPEGQEKAFEDAAKKCEAA